MDNKGITFADVSRSLNRLDGFIDDFLLTVQSYNEKRIIEKANVIVDSHKETMVIYPIDIKKSIIGFIDDVKFNREGDEAVNYYGVRDCVDYILNNQSLLLAKRAFSVETKIFEAENILISFITDIKEASDLLWETGCIISQIQELHIEPFIQGTSKAANNPIHETGENECFSIGDDSSENKIGESLTPDQIKEKIKKIEPFPKAKTDEPIPFGKYYRILTNGEFTQANGVKKEFQVIDAEKCDLDLFCLCVERADISDIIKENRQIARLFMYYVANKFKDSGEYVKAAQKALGLNARLSAVPSNYRADFYNLLGDEFPDSNPNKY